MIRIKYALLVTLLAGAMALLSGCAPTFPQQITDRVDKDITFDDLTKNIDAYKGKWVMFAGVIADLRNEKDGGSSIEIVQKSADSDGRPLETDRTGGRFIAVSKQFLDPAIHARGREITVVGEVEGVTVKPLGETSYQYPLITVEALHLWEPARSPRFGISLGIGVFHSH